MWHQYDFALIRSYGTFWLTKAAVPHIPKGGSIIVTASQGEYTLLIPLRKQGRNGAAIAESGGFSCFPGHIFIRPFLQSCMLFDASWNHGHVLTASSCLRRTSDVARCKTLFDPAQNMTLIRQYSMTKGAQVAMVRVLSNQLLSKGIRVNAVCPGRT